ncbi:MAG: MMPL family transporter [Chloroflexota bacterium]
MAARWGAFVARHRVWFLGGWLLAVAVGAVLAAGTTRQLSPAGFETDTPASQAADLLRAHFPDRKGPVLYAVFQSSGTPVTDPAYQAQVAAWRADLERLAAGAAEVTDAVPGRDGRTAALFVDSNQTPDRFITLAGRARAIQHAGPAHVYLGGLGPVYDDFVADSEADLRNSELISAPIAIVLLLLVFGGVVAGLLPVLTALAGVAVAVALLGAVARVHTVSVFALNVSSVVGLGLGIDYSLLVVNRFREELHAGATREQAVATTMATAGVATVISGGTVAIGFGALLLTHLNVLQSIGIGGSLVVAISVLSSLTLIPALLALFGGRVDSLALPFTRGRDTRPFWHRLAAVVMGRPLLFIGLVLAVVLVLASPARHLTLGVVGPESLPPNEPAVVADRIVHDQLGFARHGPVLVVAEGVRDRDQAAALEARLKAISPTAALADLRVPYAVYQLEQPADDNTDATHRFLDRVRAVAVPGVKLLVGGEAAAYQDFLDVLGHDFPIAFGTVLVATLLLLGFALRSVALPLKAVLMNLLSVAAAMGVLTWGFQEGRLARLLDFQAVGFVDATVPVIIFAALFGLSMDYEVFLLTRIREEYRAGLANQAAVAAGMERTGRIITSAALILVAVVSTLAFSHLTINKSIGVTFAVSILLDATLIRLLLAPAMMRVLGDLNWWPANRRRA